MPEAVKGDFMEEGGVGWALTPGQGWTAEAQRRPPTPTIRLSPGHDDGLRTGCPGRLSEDRDPIFGISASTQSYCRPWWSVNTQECLWNSIGIL